MLRKAEYLKIPGLIITFLAVQPLVFGQVEGLVDVSVQQGKETKQLLFLQVRRLRK